MERHGHGTGNTKSGKKRRHRENRVYLQALVLHLESLLAEAGGCADDGGEGAERERGLAERRAARSSDRRRAAMRAEQ